MLSPRDKGLYEMIEAIAGKFQMPLRQISIRTLGGRMIAIGGVSITLSGAIYGLVAPETVLPFRPFEGAAALAGAVASPLTIKSAAFIGMFADTVTIYGALCLVLEAFQTRRSSQLIGWAAILVSALIFTLSDTVAGFALPEAAADHAPGSFLDLKHLFDAFFLIASINFGMGLFVILVGSPRSKTRFDNIIFLVGAILSLILVLSSIANLWGVAAHMIVGIAMLVASLHLGYIGFITQRAGAPQI